MTQISKKDSVRAAFSRSSRRIGTFCFGAGPQQGGSTIHTRALQYKSTNIRSTRTMEISSMGDRQDESLKQPAPSLNHHKGLRDYGSVSVLRWWLPSDKSWLC